MLLRRVWGELLLPAFHGGSEKIQPHPEEDEELAGGVNGVQGHLDAVRCQVVDVLVDALVPATPRQPLGTPSLQFRLLPSFILLITTFVVIVLQRPQDCVGIVGTVFNTVYGRNLWNTCLGYDPDAKAKSVGDHFGMF